MAEGIYEPSVLHLQGKIVCHKVHHVDPIILTNFHKGILDRYNNVALYCDPMYISGIVFLNNIYRHVLFFMGSMIKTKKIAYGIKHVNKLYLQRGFKIIRIHADSEFELLRV